MTTSIPRDTSARDEDSVVTRRLPKTTEHRLADGRALGFIEHGPRTGAPLFYFHGTPSSRLEWEAFTPRGLAEEMGVRVIAPERPGMGYSDFQPSRRLAEWPADVASLADALGIERFDVIGYSGGAAYAAACAASMPDRVRAVALVSPVCHDRPDLEAGLDDDMLRLKHLCREHPLAARIALELLLGLPAQIAPQYVIAQTLKSLPAVDRCALTRPGVEDAYIAAVREAFRHGAHGPQHDMGLMIEPWAVDLGAIVARVSVWQGAEDHLSARPAMATHLCDRIRGSRLELRAEGHISIWTSHAREILGAFRAVRAA